ncbi:MAG: serine/threonine protein kinase, partial [Actinobacteria bacterium]|nr:serine/threonine protein kinase [Actinomycetota bacterium]
MSPADTARIRNALPGYDIGGQIGSGGCGEVFGGTHRELRRRVAIKQIPPQFAADPEIRGRFASEATLMAAIDHPHVVSVYDYVQHDELCLLVMEFLPGGTVEDRFQTDGFDPSTTIAIALSCAAGLAHAHQHGVLHRDVKPSNLMFATNGSVKLTDFGIAKIMGGDGQLMTRAGDILGTPAYMAPEQARGLALSPATDVYALATMTYQLLCGRLPFPSGPDSMAVLFMHAFEQPTPLSEVAPRVPQAIADVVMRGLAI